MNNNKGFGLTEMLIIIFTLVICLTIVSIIYNKNFKNVNNNVDDDSIHLNSIESNNDIDTLDNYEEEESINQDKTKYTEIEDKIANASKLYIDNNYEHKSDKIIIKVGDLVKNEYIKEIEDPDSKKDNCNGYVIYDGSSNYTAFIKCSKYETVSYNSDFE